MSYFLLILVALSSVIAFIYNRTILVPIVLLNLYLYLIMANLYIQQSVRVILLNYTFSSSFIICNRFCISRESYAGNLRSIHLLHQQFATRAVLTVNLTVRVRCTYLRGYQPSLHLKDELGTKLRSLFSDLNRHLTSNT